MRTTTALFTCLLTLVASSPLCADDGASSISVGGLVATREPRITMAKEVLAISLTKVVVDYDFRNDTDSAVTTEVAFPIPAYDQDPESADPAKAGFDDFKLTINGKPFPFQTEIKAVVKGRDVSALLRRDRIDLATFGHADESGDLSDLKKASPAERKELVAAGAFEQDKDVFTPVWKVEKRYHWTQTFPAKSVVHIRHEYSPVSGAQLIPIDMLAPDYKATADDKYVLNILRSMCVSPAAVKNIAAHKGGMLETNWVDFILTTANSWKQPIEDFTLVVERTDPKDVVSFCWDGAVTKLDANHFMAHTTNLVPGRELMIGYYLAAPAE